MTDTLQLAPPTPGFAPCPDLSCEINGQPVFVHHQPGFAGGAINWISFDFSGSVTIQVTSNWTVHSAELRPRHAGIPVSVEGRVVTFSLDRPGNYFLKWNGEFDLPFYIFANPLEEPAPSPNDANVIFFGPGEHEPGVIRPKSGQTVYLAPGSHVKGVIRAVDASQVTVRGRGVLSGTHIPFGKGPEDAKEMVAFMGGSDILLEGITILDSFSWTVSGYGLDRWTIRGIKILNERLWSTDGINPVNSRDVLIEDSFARTKDDCVTVKGLGQRAADRVGVHAGKAVQRVLVRNCVFWSDNNNGLVVGSETEAEVMEDIRFENIDLLKVSNTCGDVAGALSVISLHDNPVSHIVFENIRIEHCTGPYINVFFCNEIFRIPGRRSPEGGTLKDITFRNIEVTGGPLRHSLIRGLGPRQVIENIVFEGLRVHGSLITSADQGKFEINEYVRDVTFTG